MTEPRAPATGRTWRVAGDGMAVPAAWNRSRATALATTLGLHILAAWWLLALRFERPTGIADELTPIFLPAPEAPRLPPPPVIESTPSPAPVTPITATPLPLPTPQVTPAAPRDFSQTARDVAKSMTTEPGHRRFGEVPEGPPERPKEALPPSIWPEPLARVGKTVTTPEGETIVWVSDHCWVSLGSRSLTQGNIHEARRGVRMCNLPVGKKKPRSDLFDPIKRPPPPQEPGCNEDGVGQSCAR